MAEWSKALDLGSSHFDGVGSNPTAAKPFSPIDIYLSKEIEDTDQYCTKFFVAVFHNKHSFKLRFHVYFPNVDLPLYHIPNVF